MELVEKSILFTIFVNCDNAYFFKMRPRRIAEREYLNEVFIRMLLCSEERGPHASGMAWLRTDGDFRLFKRPIRAHRLVRESTFHELMAEVDNHTTILMGHTRWRTRGSEANVRRIGGALMRFGCQA